MTEKELRKLSRSDLLEILIEQGERLEKTEKKLEETKGKLQLKDIKINSSGTLAEAAMHITDIFKNADSAAELYLENIKVLNKETEEKCAAAEEKSKQEAEKLIADAADEAERIREKAKRESKEYWDSVYEKIVTLIRANADLRSALFLEVNADETFRDGGANTGRQLFKEGASKDEAQ